MFSRKKPEPQKKRNHNLSQVKRFRVDLNRFLTLSFAFSAFEKKKQTNESSQK